MAGFERQINNPNSIVSSNDLISLWMYRGYAYHIKKKESRALSSVEQALSMQINLSLDSSIKSDKAFSKLVKAQRKQVRKQKPLDIGRPNLYGKDRYYINGRLIHRNLKIYSGKHLLQVKCENGKTISLWTSFVEEPRWDSLCYESYVVNQNNRLSFSNKKLKIALWSLGGSALVGGLAYHYLAVEPLHRQIEAAREDPLSIYRNEADVLTSSFKQSRTNSFLFLSVGSVFVGIGFAIPY